MLWFHTSQRLNDPECVNLRCDRGKAHWGPVGTHRPTRGYKHKLLLESLKAAEPRRTLLPREHSVFFHELSASVNVDQGARGGRCLLISQCVCVSPRRTGALHSSLLTHREDSPRYTSASLDSMWIQSPVTTHIHGDNLVATAAQDHTWEQVSDLVIIWKGTFSDGMFLILKLERALTLCDILDRYPLSCLVSYSSYYTTWIDMCFLIQHTNCSFRNKTLAINKLS